MNGDVSALPWLARPVQVLMQRGSTAGAMVQCGEASIEPGAHQSPRTCTLGYPRGS